MITSLNVRWMPGVNMSHLLARLHLSHTASWVVVFMCVSIVLPRWTSGYSAGVTDTGPLTLNGRSLREINCLRKEIILNFHKRDSNEKLSLMCQQDRTRKEGGSISAILSTKASETPLYIMKSILQWASKNRQNSLDFLPAVKRQIRQHYITDDVNYGNKRTRYSAKKRAVRPYDKKVFVFGKDDRLRIFPTMMRKFPYSNIVRLSTGCTGTLVTPMHVLTAAHCVHTGTEFLNKLEMLKVELPDSFGVRYYYIEKISIPKRWLHPKNAHEHRSSWDYAIVRLSIGVYDRTQFFPIEVPTPWALNQNLQFLGFPNHEYNLWMSVCPARANKGMVDGNLIVTRCDSAVGNSGAAVLSDDPREGKKIIGVLSSTMPVGRTPYYSPFSIITAITWAKLYDICAEIGEIGVAYRVCPPLETIPKSRKININNNIIPFFG